LFLRRNIFIVEFHYKYNIFFASRQVFFENIFKNRKTLSGRGFLNVATRYSVVFLGVFLKNFLIFFVCFGVAQHFFIF